MSKIRPADIPHKVNNLVITCMDHRFQWAIAKLLMEKYKVDIERLDRLALAGSSKAAADGTLIPQVQDSYRLHGIKKVYLVDHTDCGGFGGLEAYDDDEQQEAEAHFESLDRASNAIIEVLPMLVVKTVVIGLDGQSIPRSVID